MGFLSWPINQRNFRSVLANVQECDCVVSEFEPQPRNYVHFRTNTLGKCMDSFIQAMGQKYHCCFSSKIVLPIKTHEG